MRKLRPFLAAALTLTGLSSAHAFGGEDFFALEISNWHHADISKRGALAAQFSDGAAESICWHADYVDSYGYNPLWWAQGATANPGNPLKRLKAALSAKAELGKVHFDDLTTVKLGATRDFPKLSPAIQQRLDQIQKISDVKLKQIELSKLNLNRPPRNAVELQMRRYLSGTLDGMIFAADTNDVAMAQHILGVSLHAIQDFYSHSNWIDEPSRRKQTYFDTATTGWDAMGALSLYTGTYETPTQLGVKSHGKYAFACTVMNQPGIRQVLDVGCGAFSPIASDPTCLQFKECKTGKSISGASALGVKVPNNALFLAPPGINVDSTWMAEIGAKERGIVTADFKPIDAFRTAESDAIRATEQWLRRVGAAMEKIGKGAFWRRVMTENSVGSYKNPGAAAIAQWEDFGKLGFQFVSAGTYPPKATDPLEQYFLRLRIKTANEQNAGTDADIYAVVDGKPFLLDNMPVKGESNLKKAISYNDFERGDDNVYLVGPLDRAPSTLRIENRSAGAGDVLLAAGQAFVNAIVDGVKAVVDGIIGFFKTLVGSDPDFVAQNKLVWKASELPQGVGQSRDFSVPLNGGDEGNYELKGNIRKTADVASGPGGSPSASYVVRVTQLRCIKESKWDRLSNSDEPFLLTLVNPLTGSTERKLFGPFDDVDSGETVSINYDFPAVTVPRSSGIITFPVSQWENDDESAAQRRDMLNKFAGDLDGKANKPKVDFIDTLGRALAPDWKVDSIEAWAFSKGDVVRSAQVGSFGNVGWIEGKGAKNFSLGVLPSTTVRAQDLEDMTGVAATTTLAMGSRPLIGLLGLTVGASLLGVGLLRFRRERA